MLRVFSGKARNARVLSPRSPHVVQQKYSADDESASTFQRNSSDSSCISGEVKICNQHAEHRLDLLYSQLLQDVRKEIGKGRSDFAMFRDEIANLLGREIDVLRAYVSDKNQQVQQQLKVVEENVRKIEYSIGNAFKDVACEINVLECHSADLHQLPVSKPEAAATIPQAIEQQFNVLEEVVGNLEEKLSNAVKDAACEINVLKCHVADLQQPPVSKPEETQGFLTAAELQHELDEFAKGKFEELRTAFADGLKNQERGDINCSNVEKIVKEHVAGLVDQFGNRECDYIDRSNVEKIVQENVEGLIDRMTLSYAIDEVAETIKCQMDNLARKESEVRQLYEELRAVVDHEAIVSQARYNEAQAAVADLESRCERRYGRKQEALEDKVVLLSGTIKSDQNVDVEEDEVQTATRDPLTSMVRQVIWTPEIDQKQLVQENRFATESPVFAAACIFGMRLRLIITRLPKTTKNEDRWVLGAFLVAKTGCMTFQLSVNESSQDFEACFSEQCPEMGSQKIMNVGKSGFFPVFVKLAILKASAPLELCWPSCLKPSSAVCDSAHAVALEAAALRSMMVRRVEWKILQVPDYIGAAAKGEEDGLEPLVSPLFSVAGMDNVQLRFYPKGYRSVTEGACGIFLVCPGGYRIKCRAFVGNHAKLIEHTYEEREPYGRGAFCRLIDKLNEDGSLTCGVEFEEVRTTASSACRGSPFGNVKDDVKFVVSDATDASLVGVRELHEIPTGRGASTTRENHAAVSPSRSLPALGIIPEDAKKDSHAVSKSKVSAALRKRQCRKQFDCV